MKNEQSIEKQELKRARHLAKLIRELKLNNYDSFTWESAIDNVLSKKCRDEDDFFNKIYEKANYAQLEFLPFKGI